MVNGRPDNAVVGLIDQQPKFAVLFPNAKIILFQRFACWSIRPTWAEGLLAIRASFITTLWSQTIENAV